MDTWETAAIKAADTAEPQGAPGDICAFAVTKFFLTQEEITLAFAGMCCLLLSKNKEDTRDPSNILLKGSIQRK